MSKADDSCIGMAVDDSLVGFENQEPSEAEPHDQPGNMLSSEQFTAAEKSKTITNSINLVQNETVPRVPDEFSSIAQVAQSAVSDHMLLQTNSLRKGNTESSGLQAKIGNSLVEDRRNAEIFLGTKNTPLPILEQANQEDKIQRKLGEAIDKYQKLVEREIIPMYEEELANYQAEIRNAREEFGYKDAKEVREFNQRRHETAKKVFNILKRDFDDKIHQIQDDCKNSNTISEELLRNRVNELEILYKRLDSRLTVYAKKDELVKSLREKRVTIVVGAPGCGKSTQIPQIIITENLLDQGNFRKVFMVSPRMAAARKVSERITSELSEELCRFHSGESTTLQLNVLNCSVDYEFYRRLVITKEVNLDEIEYLIIDEANSKKLYTEVILSMCRKLLVTYKHLKLVILSTSLNKFEIENFFRSTSELDVDADEAIEIDEGNFRTETVYCNFNGSTEEKINQVLITIEDRILSQLEASKSKKISNPNILMFLKGAADVRNMHQKFNEWLPDKIGLISLSEKLKQYGIESRYKLFMASGASDVVLDNDMLTPNDPDSKFIKLIFSTKVLETSLTIPNLGYVVDFGEEHLYAFDHKVGVEILREQRISKDTAIQRRGRVGRTCKGVCFRLYKEEDLTDDHSQSELAYKRLDMLILSWIPIVLEFRKSKDNPFFDLKVKEAADDSGVQEEAQQDLIEVLSSHMSKFVLISEIDQEGIKKSLSLMKDLSIIDKKTLTDGTGNIFRVVLASGVELCFGKTIYKAIEFCAGNTESSKLKDSKGQGFKDPWLLAEVITMVACNTFNRKIMAEKLPMSLEKTLDKLMKEYGDFAYNYEIYKTYDEKSKESADMLAPVNILIGFRNNAHMIRSRIQKLLHLPNGFFRNVQQQYGQKVPLEERYRSVTYCLTFGFSADISMHIADQIGYYNHRTKQVVQIAKDLLIREGSGFPKFMIVSDILAQESRYISRFCFKVDMELIKTSFSKIHKYLTNLDQETIPSKVVARSSLSSETLHQLIYRDFMIKQILDKKDGTILAMSERSLDFKVALTGKSEKKSTKRIDALIQYMEENLNNHTVELFLEGCRVSVGNGLQVTDIITYRETPSFYHFLVPRYISEDNCVHSDGDQLKTEDGKVGPWDFLLFDYKRFFGIEGKATRCETTVSKVNYILGPQMNLKVSCKSLKDMEQVRESIKHKGEMLNYEHSNVSLKRFEVKFYDKQTYTNDLGNIMKPIILGVQLFTKQNLGNCTIKGVSSIEVDDVMKLLQAESKTTNSIFGPNLKILKGKDGIDLSGLPPELDEVSIEKFLKKHSAQIMYSDISILMYKKSNTDLSFQTEDLDVYQKQVERFIQKMIDAKQQTMGPDERFPNEFVCRRSGEKNLKYMVEVQVRVTNYELVELIKEHLDGRYYPAAVSFEGPSIPNYKLGLAYTHVVEYDRPEFYCQKHAFMKFRGFIDDLNKTIEREVESYLASSPYRGKGDRDSIKRNLTKVMFPDEDWLNSLKPDENVRITIVKGAHRQIADETEKILVNYFRGQEFHIEPEQYSFWFGGEGKRYIEELKSSKTAIQEYAIISTIPNRSLIVLKALFNSLNKKQDRTDTIESAIDSKILALKARQDKSSFIKVSLREIELLQKSSSFKGLKQSLSPDETVSTFTNYGGLVVCEAKNTHQMEKLKTKVRAELEKVRETQKFATEFEKTVCCICNERGNIQRLHICKHHYCYICLQTLIFKALNIAENHIAQKTFSGLNEPYVFCPELNCNKPIASCDIFKVLSENMITEKMRMIVRKILSYKKNTKDLIVCANCKAYNKVNTNSKLFVCMYCNQKQQEVK